MFVGLRWARLTVTRHGMLPDAITEAVTQQHYGNYLWPRGGWQKLDLVYWVWCDSHAKSPIYYSASFSDTETLSAHPSQNRVNYHPQE